MACFLQGTVLDAHAAVNLIPRILSHQWLLLPGCGFDVDALTPRGSDSLRSDMWADYLTWPVAWTSVL